MSTLAHDFLFQLKRVKIDTIDNFLIAGRIRNVNMILILVFCDIVITCDSAYN